jgi:hypothetical protein
MNNQANGFEGVEEVNDPGTFTGTGTGAIARAVGSALDDRVNLMNFIPAAYRAGVAARTIALSVDLGPYIQAWLDEVFRRNGAKGYAPAGLYPYRTDIQPQIDGTTSRFFTLEGDGMEVTRFVTNNASTWKIWGDTAPARDNAFVSLDFDKFEISNASGTRSNTGLDLYSVQRSWFGAVRIAGFDLGAKARSSWNVTISRRAQLVENNVGFKVPKAGSGATLNEGVNALDISGVSLANNIKAGASIGFANVLTIRDALTESNPVAVYLVEAIQHVRLEQFYYEAGAITLRESDRDGTLTAYILYCGKDEDGVAGDTASPVKNVDLAGLMSNSGEGKIYLENVDGVHIPHALYGRSYVQFGANVRNVRINAISGDDRISTPLVATTGRSIVNNVLRSFPNNMIPNGTFAYNGLPYFTVAANAGSASAAIGSVTLDGRAGRVLDVTLPDTGTTITATWIVVIPAGAQFAADSALVVFSIHAKASSADVASVKVAITDQSGNEIASRTKSSGLTSWFVVSVEVNPNELNATISSLTAKVVVTRTSGTGDEHLYIEEARLARESDGELLGTSPTDVEIGHSGTGTCTTSSGSWYYAEIDSGYGDGNYFDVIATPIYDSAQSTTDLQVQKLSGGDAGKFRVWSNKNNAAFAYRVLPRLMRLP